MCRRSSECKCKRACWPVETPDEPEYQLVMFDGGGDSVQTVDMTRDEFIDLKEYLARTRGCSRSDRICQTFDR